MGQLSPGSTVQFRRVSWSDSLRLLESHKKWLHTVDEMISLQTHSICPPLLNFDMEDSPQSPVLCRYPPSDNKNSTDLQIVFRQVLRMVFVQGQVYSNNISL